jgi:twinkle protein
MASDVFYDGDFSALRARGITEETCRKFGYKVGKLSDGRGVQLAPYYTDGVLTATKVRPADKDAIFSTGDMSEVELFGQHLWSKGGKKVVVTEGEIDAMTVSQVQGNKWPTVSVPKGAKDAKKSIARNIEWLSSFEEVILMFDMDEPGQEAAKECAALFKPGSVKIASLPMKDPNDLLKAGKGELIITAMWQAQPWRPDGIVSIRDIKAQALAPVVLGLPWFSEALTAYTYGRRGGEIYALGAGTGIGKTDFLTQQIQYDVDVLNEKVGLFMLEQQPTETLKRVAGKFAGKCFHIPDDGWTPEELATTLDRMEEADNIFFYDNFGATDWDVIATTIRFLTHSAGVRIFYIDHLTALAAAEEDERKGLERILAEMGALVKELNITIILVSHLATPEGTPHEEGGRVMIRHFKGSRAIGFWCHFMFGMERAQQHEDERLRSITTFRVLKDRYTGRSTGKVIYLGYKNDTGLLFETELPEEEAAHGFTDTTSHNPDF